MYSGGMASGMRQVKISAASVELLSRVRFIDHDPDHECQLYWVPDSISLREFKKAITGFVIFRYRLKFFLSADQYFLEKIRTDIVEEEEQQQIPAAPNIFRQKKQFMDLLSLLFFVAGS